MLPEPTTCAEFVAYARQRAEGAAQLTDRTTFQGCVDMAIGALVDAIQHLQRAGELAADASERKAVTAPIAGLDLARQHVTALRSPGGPTLA